MNWGNTWIKCIWKVRTQVSSVKLCPFEICWHHFMHLESIKDNRCEAHGELGKTYIRCTPHLISDVQYSCFMCCTKFLFSMLYKIPVFIDVQYSCFLWCTIFLYSVMYNIPVSQVVKNGTMYLIPVWHVVPISDVGKSFFSNLECCTIFWCIQVCVPEFVCLFLLTEEAGRMY